MIRPMRALLPALAIGPAIAQTTSKVADAPAEQASPVVVAVFLVLFIGACVGFVAYSWWRGRKKEDGGSL